MRLQRTVFNLSTCVIFAAIIGIDGNLIAQQTSLSDFPAELKTREPKNAEELVKLEKHVQALIPKLSAATISFSGGSGVVISEDGYILTAAHVNRESGRKVQVVFPDGKRVQAETLGNNFRNDFGLLKISEEGEFPFVEVADSGELKLGEWCLSLGFAFSYQRGKNPASRLGRVLRNTSRTIVSDCTIMGGDSGGPLFNLDGKVIGIHSRVSNSLNQNFHIPVNLFMDSWDRLADGEDWDRGRVGGPAQGYLGVRSKEGATEAEVGELIPDGAAERAGVQVGDVILKLNGRDIANFDQLVERIGRMRARQRTRLEIRRGDEVIEITLRLGRRE